MRGPTRRTADPLVHRATIALSILSLALLGVGQIIH